jgi:hypothetical protein
MDSKAAMRLSTEHHTLSVSDSNIAGQELRTQQEYNTSDRCCNSAAMQDCFWRTSSLDCTMSSCQPQAYKMMFGVNLGRMLQN